jgi:hypothetical protein
MPPVEILNRDEGSMKNIVSTVTVLGGRVTGRSDR